MKEAPDLSAIERTVRRLIDEVAPNITKQQTPGSDVAAAIDVMSETLQAMRVVEDSGTSLPDWWKPQRNRLVALALEFRAVLQHKRLHGDN